MFEEMNRETSGDSLVTEVKEQISAANEQLKQESAEDVIIKKELETAETRTFKDNFLFFGIGTLVYALFYTFCTYKNDAGITFLFFIAASLFFLHLSFTRLGLTWKRGSGFYMAVMVLLSVATFTTDSVILIFFNKTAIFLLTMSLMLTQFFRTVDWGLGHYLGCILLSVFSALGEMFRPITDGMEFFQRRTDKKYGTAIAVLVGILIGLPLLIIVMALLSSADVFFKQLTDGILRLFNFVDIMGITFKTVCMFVMAYGMLAFFCMKKLKEEEEDHRNGNPLIATTVTAMLTVCYLLFSGIQIMGLFLGKMTLPAGYTYAQYAREGFFQLLFVGLLNLVIVLVCLHYFKESKVLKGILTVMSLCTFIMNASSAMRMMLYVKTYDLSFLRILVLWSLVVLTLLFIGVLVTVFKGDFKLFRYSVVVVSLCYLVLTFAHPDYIIAKYNLSKVNPATIKMEEAGRRIDYSYLQDLSADAAPAIIEFLEKAGYTKADFVCPPGYDGDRPYKRNEADGFWRYYIKDTRVRAEMNDFRCFNLSRYRFFQLVNE